MVMFEVEANQWINPAFVVKVDYSTRVVPIPGDPITEHILKVYLAGGHSVTITEPATIDNLMKLLGPPTGWTPI